MTALLSGTVVVLTYISAFLGRKLNKDFFVLILKDQGSVGWHILYNRFELLNKYLVTSFFFTYVEKRTFTCFLPNMLGSLRQERVGANLHKYPLKWSHDVHAFLFVVRKPGSLEHCFWCNRLHPRVLLICDDCKTKFL